MKITILEENNIKYCITYAKAKKIRLKFSQEGILNIAYPLGCKQESVIRFIEENINWIKEKSIIVNEKIVSYNNGAYQYFFGKQIQVIINLSKTRRIDYIHDTVMVSTNKIENVRNDVIQWRFNQAEFVFQELLYKCFEKMKQELNCFPTLIIKKSRSKWGCCYFNENRIMLNLALTQVPFYLIEYVIFHELTHFIYHNHSQEFHRKLQEYVPNERSCAKELKKYPTLL
jgi:zinc metalloprotease, putative